MPLILRGARQVGKTTLVNFFGEKFDQYLYFNLEKNADKQLFENIENLETTIQLLFLARNKISDKKKTTLIFIDEVQEKPSVLSALRYFCEDYPHFHVIVSGSLLEFALENLEKVPVGRIEYAELHPLNFEEFLKGENSDTILNILKEVPIKNELLGPIFQKFHTYAMIGGMPKITSTFINEQNLSRVVNLYAAIITAYKSDIEKYAQNNTQREILRHIMDTAPFEMDNRIKLNNFGGSSFKSREVKEAISALEKAKILELVYPTTNTSIPTYPDFKKSPRLSFLDVGLVNFQLGLHKELLNIKDLNDSSRGKLVQQIVMQELKSTSYLPNKKINFWVREEHGTSSEIDIVYPYKNLLIPIEIKSGASGTLRSLHEFMDRCTHNFAIRFFGGKISIDTLKTNKGKEYKLLNLPYFLGAHLDKYLDWFIAQ
ncbi:DUF4143 domain-containing protein [Lacihabitans sp. LS3-19]|uniref:ATP-binding protein n=1 Tax=Lacihabitans sp. LS3-19 TaxID=2487335 RepID=UPI0020CB74B9|nr:AAA family ATPase [Lacihabitans sp. LS3-19]MCP9767321.1 DUF4143 domain-containing protein [Lacihabitans sp. LS3-19]